MITRIRQGCLTGAGWCCLWDTAAFRHVVDEAAHFDALIDQDGVLRSIAAGGLVPINDFADGGYDIGVIIAADLNESPLNMDEISSTIAISKPYRFCTAGEVCISGMEYVSNPIDEIVVRHYITPGAYLANVYRFDAEHPQMPEFVVALQRLTSGHEGIEFCTDVDTFCQQPTLPTGHVGFRVHTCDNWRLMKQRIMNITGHNQSGVSVLKDHEPVYLGNGHQDPQRIVSLVQPLMEAVTSLNGTFEFVIDGQPVEPSTVMTMFGRVGDG